MTDEGSSADPDRRPRSARYPISWVLDLDMGPHPLWQLEDLLDGVELPAGGRVLDLGSGRGATSVFLAREYDVDVVAADLWVDPEEVAAVCAAARVADRVDPQRVDARALPFRDGEFDAVVSVDAFEYFGTDVHFLPGLLRVLRPGGLIAVSSPALRPDPYGAAVPDFVRAVVGWEAAAWHEPRWWQRHWELTGLVDDVCARWQDGGGNDWRRWARAGAERRGVPADPVLAMLQQDTGGQLGFALITARKRSGPVEVT
jgi:cyclopropane fatty-acyl-phospholipid synthase-like methyltransferase